MIKEYWSFAGSNARCGNSKTRNKRLSDILMISHALEKGFSLPDMRKSFGQKKAKQLCSLILSYIDKFGYDDSLIIPISLLESYISFHKSNAVDTEDLQKISSDLDKIVSLSGKHHEYFHHAGSIEKNAGQMIQSGKGDFKTLALGRYSVRNFSNVPLTDEQIQEAISIAQKSPSACNRQSYCVHVLRGATKDNILGIQGGSKSFFRYADTAFLITADLNRYYTNEMHLGYVDGSLFGMSLIYALTYLGIGSIPLTLGIDRAILSNMKSMLGIPESEMPVLLIAAGNYADNFKVSMSDRNPLQSFVTYHN